MYQSLTTIQKLISKSKNSQSLFTNIQNYIPMPIIGGLPNINRDKIPENNQIKRPRPTPLAPPIPAPPVSMINHAQIMDWVTYKKNKIIR